MPICQWIRTMPIAEAIQKLKANSSRWLTEHGAGFEWQKGYATFSVSPSMVEAVKTYIRNQEASSEVELRTGIGRSAS